LLLAGLPKEKEAKWLKQPSAPPPMALPLPLLLVALLLPGENCKNGTRNNTLRKFAIPNIIIVKIGLQTSTI